MANNFYLSAISETLEEIKEEIARANRLKRYELNKQYPRDPNIDIAYFGGIDNVP